MNMNNHYPFFNTPLPYAYNALEPFIDETTMRLHHDRHLQIYIDNLNGLLEENPSLRQYSLEELLTCYCSFPCRLQTPVRNYAGGVYSHRFYFEGMNKAGTQKNAPALFHEISRQFGNMETFKICFKEAALSVFGSGYAWLIWESGFLKIITSANQNVPDLSKETPLLNIDVWEHAYYLKHYNMRAAYVNDWFQVVDWERIEERFRGCFAPHKCSW